jgi:8-oxo-dGTP pyrophosphatase MutT (NUDIX family)
MITVRVYGILLNERKEVLVSDELIRGNYFTKFPGGGLEFGEGTRACLQREFQEEMHYQSALVSIFIHRFYQKVP